MKTLSVKGYYVMVPDGYENDPALVRELEDAIMSHRKAHGKHIGLSALQSAVSQYVRRNPKPGPQPKPGAQPGTAPDIDQATIDKIKKMLEDSLRDYGMKGSAGQLIAVLSNSGAPLNPNAGKGAKGWNDPDLELRPSDKEREATKKIMRRSNAFGIAGGILAGMADAKANAIEGMRGPVLRNPAALGTNTGNAMMAGAADMRGLAAGLRTAGDRLSKYYASLAEQYLGQDRLARSLAAARNERSIPAALWNSAYRNQPKVGD